MIITPHEKGKDCLINVQLTADNFTRLNGLPGFKKWDNRTLRFRPTGANIAYLQKHWPDAKWQKGSIKYVEEFAALAKHSEDTKKLKGKSKIKGDESFAYKTKPYEHQRKAFILSRDQENFALFMEQGTGKTKVIIDNAAYLFSIGLIDCLLIVSVNGVHRNWIETELPVHMPDWCPTVSYFHRSSESDGSRKKKLEAIRKSKGKLKVIAVNIEALASSKATMIIEQMLLSNKTMFVIDESTRIKNSTAKRTKYIINVGEDAAYRRILTGTPVTRGPEDLFSQFKFLSPKILGFDSYYTFRNHFCDVVNIKTGPGKHDSFPKIQGYNNLDELTAKVDGVSFRVLKDDCLDLPPKVYKRWPVDLTKEQWRVYKELNRNFTTEMDGSKLDAELALTRLLRLQQITSNWWPGEDPRPIVPDNRNPKLIALQDILEETQGKVIIWARFKPDLLLIKKLLGNRAVSYFGGETDTNKALAVKRFQEDDSILYFVGNAQSGGLGLTLTAAGTVVYYSNDFSLEKRLQSEDRPHRIGQTRSVLYIDIEATGTTDRKVIATLKARKLIADLINQDPVSFFMEESE